jgi:hypothetical protein
LQTRFSKKWSVSDILRDTQEVEVFVMNPFRQVTHSFVMTFGITPPRPEQELKATIFICTMLLGTVLLVIGLGVFVLGRIF